MPDRTEARREAQAATGDFVRPWDRAADGEPAVHRLLADSVDQIVSAIGQITKTGTADDKSAATEVLADTRRALYRLLGDSE